MPASPLFYMIVGLAGMLLSAGLFDHATRRYLQPASDPVAEPPKPSLPALTLRLVGGGAVMMGVLLALYGTNIVVADLLLAAGCLLFAVAAHRTRIKPLLVASIQPAHLMLLVVALCVWVFPMAWAVHLHAARAYESPCVRIDGVAGDPATIRRLEGWVDQQRAADALNEAHAIPSRMVRPGDYSIAMPDALKWAAEVEARVLTDPDGTPKEMFFGERDLQGIVIDFDTVEDYLLPANKLKRVTDRSSTICIERD